MRKTNQGILRPNLLALEQVTIKVVVAHLCHACIRLEELNSLGTEPKLQAGKIKVYPEVSISKLAPILCLDCFSNPFIGKTRNVERIAGLFARVDNLAPKGLHSTGGQLA